MTVNADELAAEERRLHTLGAQSRDAWGGLPLRYVAQRSEAAVVV